jgi:HrpA-like RNA helicase
MSNPGTSEWSCVCKDCLAEFRYSNTNHEQNQLRGFSRPERCPECRKQHSKEVNTVGQPYFKVKPRFPSVDHEKLESVLGRLNHPARPHRAEHVVPPGEPPDKFGIKDDKIVEMFRWFAQDPGLQVVVVVGPTGSGKSTYFPYRLVHPPRNYTTTEPDPASPTTRRPVCGPDGKPLVFDASDVQPDLFHRYGQIVVTQPRIQATRNIPGYIARAMLGSSLGAGFDIGYQYAKNPASDWRSKLRFCTDGSLINWIATGQLDKINTVMIDEAHERSLNIDIIIGLLTQALPRYPRLKLIIASATISADLFIDHFNKHLPRRSPAKMLRLGDETASRRKLTLTATERDAAGRPWLLKPADNCELMEFDGKSFRVDPHFHEGPPLDYAFLDPSPKDKTAAEAVEARLQKLAKVAHEKVAEKAVALLRAMYLTPDALRQGKGLKVTKSVEPDGTIPKAAPVIDVTERRGDVLGFLHGETPILECCKLVRAAAAESGFPCKVEALPLFTQLPQGEQDKALLERTPGIHDKLVDRIVRLIESGKTDVLAAYDNVGQFATIRRMLEGRVKLPLAIQRWAGEDAVELKPDAACEKKAGAKLDAKPVGGVRVVVASSRALAVWGVPYETTSEGADARLADSTFAFVPQEVEIRRVVVSTNVAETSLTIHGILHVVDSGLINQNKWMPDTQTTGVRPILQSRAGCKQRWGRAGRLQAGDAWPLYTREQFGLDAELSEPLGSAGDVRCFPYYSQPEIRRSPLEQVLLTAKKSGLESLDVANFPWLEPPDAEELIRAEASLKGKGALDTDGRLTAHGLELSGFQSEARLANLMVVADRMACAVEMATVLAVLKIGYGKLFVKNKEWDEATAKRVQEVQAALTGPCGDDLEAALKIVAGWELARSAGQALADLWAWRSAWARLATSQEGPARSLANVMGAVPDEDGFAAVRPAKGDPLGPVFNNLRVEAARGVKRRATWAEAASQWDVVTRLPAFAAAWRASATEMTRIEGVADEVLRAALNRPTVPAFLATLAAVESRVPALPPDPATPAPDPATQETLRREAAEKFLAAVTDTLAKLGRTMPSRGATVPDSHGSNPKAEEETDAAWRKLDSLARDFVRNLGPRFRGPAPGTSSLAFIEAAEAARSLADFEMLAGEGAWLARVRTALPTVAAEAWCAASYVDSRAIADKDKIESARNELIDALSGHKKEEERRPLNFALLDRLRLIFAHALPDHCYELAGDGYQPVQPGPAAMPAVIEKDSICAARAPRLMVCANRRALPADAKGQRKLGAGFVVVLDGKGVALSSALIRGEGGRKPLGVWSTLSLAAHLPELAPAQAAAETASARARLLLDQRFPLGSEWAFVLAESDGDGWLATGSLVGLRGEVRKRYRNDPEADTGDDTDPGGDFTSSTFAVKTPDPVLDPESPDAEGAAGSRRPTMITEGVSPDTPLGAWVRDEDREREAQSLFDNDSDAAESPRPHTPTPTPKSVPFRIRFVAPPPTGPDRVGASVRGWVIGFEHVSGKSPVVLLGRRSPREAIEALKLGEVVLVEVVGRAAGDKPGVRVRVQGTEAEATMTPRDFGYRDDFAVTEAILAEWEKNQKLTFLATIWETVPDDVILRLTTFQQIEDWIDANQTLPESGTLVRSNPGVPDRVSVIFHSDPVNGLVIAADASGTQFADVLSGTEVPIRLDRPRDGRRPPDVKRTCTLPAGAKDLGIETLLDAGKTRYVGNVNDKNKRMSVAARFELIGLASADETYRAIVDNLFELSNGLFAESPESAKSADALADDIGQELIGRVVEVKEAGVNLEAADKSHPAAALKLWLSKKECGGDAASRFAVGDEIVVRPLGETPAAGQLNVTLRPSPGWLVAGTPTKIATRRDDDKPSGLQVGVMSGVEVFCPLGELFPNVENPTALIDISNPRPMPFLVRPPQGGRTDVTLSHKRAALMALRCLHHELLGQTFRGEVSIEEQPRNDGKPPDVFASVSFGPRLRARCSFGDLGLGRVWHSHRDDIEELLSAGRPVQLDFVLTDIFDDHIALTAEPVWGRWAEQHLRGRVFKGRVVGVSHPFINIRISPFVVGGCHAAQWDGGNVANVGSVARIGDPVTVSVIGFDKNDNLRLDRAAAIGKPPLNFPPSLAQGRTDLASLLEEAIRRLMAALIPVENAIERRDLDSADKAIRAFRALFPTRDGEACPFAHRVTLFRQLHDRLATGDPQIARRYWPASPQLPPAPPGAVRITHQAVAVSLAWKASAAPASGVTYRVSRSGTTVADRLDKCEFTDTTAPPGTKLEYVVAAVANGKETPAPPVSLIVPGEVSDLVVIPGDRQVNLAWKSPPAADMVEVWRQPMGQDVSQSEWRLIARTTTHEYVDDGLPNEQSFCYRVAAVYGRATSTGLPRETTPFRPPVPVAWDSVGLSEDSVTLTWQSPARGDVSLALSPRPLSTGVFPSAAFPCNLTRLPKDGKLKVQLPASGVYHLAPVVEDRGVVVVGEAALVEWVEPIRNLKSAGYRAGRLHLVWDWPDGVTLAKLSIRSDRPPAHADDGKTATVRRAELQSAGKYEVPLPEGQAFVHVFGGATGIVSTPAESRECYTRKPAEFAGHLREPRIVRYQVQSIKKWMGLVSSGNFDLTVTSIVPVKLPLVVVVVRSGEAPRDAKDGDVVHQFPDGTVVAPEKPFVLRMTLGHVSSPRLRLFAVPPVDWLTFEEV